MLFWEETIKGEHTQTSRLLSGYSDTECLGLLTSHRPSTLAISVSLMEHSITRMNCVFYLSMCLYPDLFGELFNKYDFSCLMLAGQVTTCIPFSKAWITTLQQWIARVG